MLRFFPVRGGSTRRYLALLLLTFSFVVTGLHGPRQPVLHAQQDGRIDVLIAFHTPPGLAEQAIVRAAGGTIRRTYLLIPAVAASIPAAAFGALANNPRIRAVELDGTVTALDAELDNTWGVKRIGAGNVHSFDSGFGVKVAVIDTGIDYNHPELGLNYAGGWDFVNNDNDPKDDNGHGTHVAGTIAALDNGTGVVGVAPQANIYALKVLGSNGSGSFSNVIAALDWAKNHGIQVTNNSYGSSSNPGSIVQSAFDAADAAGVLNIAAAGNSGTCSGSTNTVGYPAQYASVVAVAATDSNDQRPCWSSTGAKVELAAPGVSINSTKNGGGYVVFSGTSMATPHVVGTAALVIKAGVGDSNGNGRINDETRKILTNTALDLGVVGRDTFYGFGLVQAAAAVAAAPGGGSGGGGGGSDGATIVKATTISYWTSGGITGKRDLFIKVTVANDKGNAVGGANVSISLKRNGSAYGTGSGTTDSIGQLTFKASNAPSGTYHTDITGMTAAGLTWDGVTPPNSYVKP